MTDKRRLISSGSQFEEDFAYSRAVIQGPWCFVSGTTGYDYTTMQMPQSAVDQANNALETIKSALEQAGFSLNDAVRVQYTITDAALATQVQPAIQKHFGVVRPAATMVVAGLIDPAMLIEIELTAFRQ